MGGKIKKDLPSQYCNLVANRKKMIFGNLVK